MISYITVSCAILFRYICIYHTIACHDVIVLYLAILHHILISYIFYYAVLYLTILCSLYEFILSFGIFDFVFFLVYFAVSHFIVSLYTNIRLD